MTTQWTADAYEDLSISESRKNHCKRVAMVLVNEALRHYQKFDKSVPRELNSKRWKPIKSSNNVTMYRERTPSRRVKRDSYIHSVGWKKPRVIAGHGTISGNMDDLLYGLVNGDEAAMLQSVNYSGQPVTNAQILAMIEKPTLEHPYRCTTIQWHVASPSPAFRGVVKDRDAVYIRATGVLQVSESERIGYNLGHSIDLSSTPPLEERGIIRSRASTCVLFKPISDQSVEVFTKAYYEVFGNNLLDSIGAITLASALMDSWISTHCAKLKKLSWLLQRKNVNKADVMSFIGKSEVENELECQTCRKHFRSLRKAYHCALCDSPICGACSISIELHEVVLELKLTTKKIYICAACDKFIGQVSSYVVAGQEIVAGRYEKGGSGSTIVDPLRIAQLSKDLSALSGEDTCAGAVDFIPDQLSSST